MFPELDPPLGQPLDWMLRNGHHLNSVDIKGASCGAIFDAPEPTATHRFVLWRIWESRDAKPLVVIGLNPSTATHLVDDPTIRRCIGFARAWGYGGLVMLNLFSLRSTDPAALDYRNPRTPVVQNWPESVTGGPEHDSYLKFFTAPDRAGAVLAAWGNHGWIAGRCAIVEDMLEREGVTLLALGITKQDRPLHPLYVRADTIPRELRRERLARQGIATTLVKALEKQ